MMDFTTPPKRQAPPRRSWLDDEPDARPQVRPITRGFGTEPVSVSPLRKSQANSDSKSPRAKLSVDIQFTRPQFSRLKRIASWTRRHVSRRQVVISCIVVLVLGGGWTGLMLRKQQLDRQAATHPRQSLANPGASGTLDLPAFVPAVPATEQELLTPDGTRSRYDKTKASYSFTDSVKGQQFTVSEQQLGGSLGTGQTAIDNVAKSLKATTPLKTGWGTAYILTNKKYNSQTVVFGVRDLLGFIQSSFTLTNDQWATYINNLE